MRLLHSVLLAALLTTLWQGTASALMPNIADPVVESWVAELVQYLNEEAHAISPEVAQHFQSGQTVSQAEIVTMLDQVLETARASNDRAMVICALKLAMHYEHFIAITDFRIEPLAFPYRGAGNSIPEALFSLVPSDHWAYNAISYLREHGMLQSYPPDFFSGQELHSRYEFAVAISLLLEEFSARESDPALYSSGLDEEQLRIMLETLRAEFSYQLCELDKLGVEEDPVGY